MKKIFLMFFVFSYVTAGFCSECEQNEMTVAADHLDFDGEKLILTGHAEVDHEWGGLNADLMVLESKSNKKKNTFDHLEMDGHVSISLVKGGILKAAKAVLDEKKLTGIFLSGPGQERVIYSEKKENNVAFVIESDEMQIELSEEEKKAKKIHMIIAEGDVIAVYNDFKATSDRAVFKRNLEEDISQNPSVLIGGITLSCNHQERQCCLTNGLENEILSTEIFIDTNQKEFIFKDPQGSFKHIASSPLTFKSNRLVWNDQTLRMVLSGGVEIIQHDVMKIETDNDVLLVLNTIDGKKSPRGLETNGKTTLTYKDPETGADHLLKSHGSLRVDHQKMEARLQSPKDTEGNTLVDKQVFFKDEKGEIYADKAFVKYEYIDQKIIPSRIVLQGNVKIMNSLAKSNNDKTPVNQYILTDRVDFIPQTKEMIFKGAQGRRVLLFDSTNNLQVSAVGLKIVREKAVQKETIQGLGDVRFSFVEGELDQLRRHFSFDKNGSGK